jgi:iron complex transport system substrate-binding protein
VRAGPAVAALWIAGALAAARAAPLHLGPPAPARAQRIVSLAPSLSELVLALGAGERLVGVTRFDDDPRTAKLPRVGGYNDPEPETVLELRPDLVLAQPAPSNRGPVEALARLGVPIDVLPLSRVRDVEEALVAVAHRLGDEARGRALADGIERHRVEVRARVAALPKVRALLVFGLEPLVVAGPTSFAGELLDDAGGAALIDDRARPFVRLSAEAAVAARPELILLCGVQARPGREALPGLPGVPVRELRSSALLHPGPRLAEALDDLVAALHPDGAR